MKKKKRIFFGCKVTSLWPEELPKGRVIAEDNRHLTLAFLGNVQEDKIESILSQTPKPFFKTGPCGWFGKCIFLPEKEENVVAFHAKWAEDELSHYQKKLTDWLKSQKLITNERQWLPHLTISRRPFDNEEWKEAFSPFPFFVTSINLFESLGGSQYRSLWSYPLHPPFEEFEHTADVAFHIYGKDLNQIFLHAYIALAFEAPSFLLFFKENLTFDSLDDIIIQLNEILQHADEEIGCPFKAISFHGEIKQTKMNLLHWEMIVDV